MSLDKLGGQTTGDSITESAVSDSTAESLLSDILEELRIMNLHLSLITDNAGLKDV